MAAKEAVGRVLLLFRPYLLGRLGVAAPLQGRGLGAALVAGAIRIAREAREDAA